MKMFQKILAGIDLSSEAELVRSELSYPNREVVRQAMNLAVASGAELCFYSALDVSEEEQRLINAQSGTVGNVVDSAYRVLEELAELAAQRNVQSESALGFGSSWDRLIRRVNEHRHDLLISGTRDRGPVARILFGSTAMKLLRYCPCPVWITKSQPDDDKTIILAAHDLTEVGQRALETAASMAEMCGGRLLVFHAFETMPHYGLAGSDVTAAEERIRYNASNEKLRAYISLLTNCAAFEIIVKNGKPDLELLMVLAEREVDVVVMGTRGRTGLGAMFIGNTAERLLPELNCSVVAIKPDGYLCPI